MPSNLIKLIIYLVALLGVTPTSWAGAPEEVAAIGQQRAAAFEKGDVDTFIAAFADNAVFTPSLQAFRGRGQGGGQGLRQRTLRSLSDAPHCRSAGLHAGVCERHYRFAECVLRPDID